jgi:hypothetical protein|tara:strand:+ start:1716 stop:2261 length:546 start_codon:yes stop_codon:yes gene_type:complete
MISLGLDISTSCTGWCILDHDNSILDIGYINTSKEKSLFKKAEIVSNHLDTVDEKFKIDNIFIEENLQSFRSGFSSARTISTLAKFNGIVSFLCFDKFSKEPIFLNVNSARKSLNISIKRKKDGGLPVKEQLLKWAVKNVDYQWPRKTLKSGPRKGLDVPDPGSYDMVDAYIVTKAGIITL